MNKYKTHFIILESSDISRLENDINETIEKKKNKGYILISSNFSILNGKIVVALAFAPTNRLN